MTTTLITTFAATLLVASALGASAALAGGDYYVGGAPDAVRSRSQAIDTFRTNSIGNGNVAMGSERSAVSRPHDRGDYRSIAPGSGR